MLGDPRGEYEARLKARQLRAAFWAARRSWLAHARLFVFIAGSALAGIAVASPSFSALWPLSLLVIFIGLVVVHDSAKRSERRATRAAQHYTRGLARLDSTWAGSGRTGESFADAGHPYADHLDLFGTGSLFELLSQSQTRGGETQLAEWLCAPAEPDEIRARQQAVEELRPAVDLREDLAVLGPEIRAGLDPDALARWGSRDALLTSGASRWLAAGLTAGTLAATAGALWAGSGLGPLLMVLGAQLVFSLGMRRRVRTVIEHLDRPARELGLLSGLLARLEAERFGAARLVELRAALDTGGEPPSRRIARLRLFVDLLEARRNQLFTPLAPLLLWTTHLAFAVEAWRATCGPALAGWLEALSELEALGDLAGYAYEHPDDPFPEISGDAPRFEADGLGHPLLPPTRCVRNDLRLDGSLSLLVVSGSNMSGKSTLLRSVGTNAVLALAGAPVRATRLRISPLALGASIRILDSLQEGSSRFYTEIHCLQRVVELTRGPRPVLFLLDEILGGTNSHDRGIGATAVVRGLVERGAVGLVTTHDLALTAIADELGPRAENVHFEDQLVDGQMHFDYQLRDGVVRRSNALELMRAVGLDV